MMSLLYFKQYRHLSCEKEDWTRNTHTSKRTWPDRNEECVMMGGRASLHRPNEGGAETGHYPFSGGKRR